MNNFEKTKLSFNKTYYNSTRCLNFNVFILYGFHTLVNLFINLRPVIMIWKYSASSLYCTCRQSHITSCKFAIYLLDTLAKLKGDTEISTNTEISPILNWSNY